MSPRDVYLLLADWVIGTLFWPYRFAKRWYLRLKLRRRMRALGMIPAVAVLWASWEVAPIARAIAQTPSDSLIGTTLSRAALGVWNGGNPIRVFCITFSAEKQHRPHLLAVIDAAPADTTIHPLCPDPDGGFYPLWIDGPTCPPGHDNPFTEREWIIVRCGPNDISRYVRPVLPERKAQ